MTMPTTINTTYALGSQVQSADLNDCQIFIVSLYAPIDIAPASNGFARGGTNPATLYDLDGSVSSTAGVGREWNCPLDFPDGMIISEIHVECLEADAGGEEITLRLWEYDTGAANQIGDTITTGTSGAVVVHTWDDVTNDSVDEIPYTVVAGKRLVLAIGFFATSAADEARVTNINIVRV